MNQVPGAPVQQNKKRVPQGIISNDGASTVASEIPHPNKREQSQDVNSNRHPPIIVNRNMGITSNVNNPHFINHAPTNQNMMSPSFRGMNQNSNFQKNFIDPYTKVTSKAKKIIENVERQRQTPADPKVCSTGGSFD